MGAAVKIPPQLPSRYKGTMTLSPVELAATVTGLVCVALTVRQHIGCWPVGIVSAALFIVVFHRARLYSDMGLQGIYVVLQVYGWIHWARGGRGDAPLPVRRVRRREAWTWAGVALLGSGALGWAMDTLTNADLPYPDALTTVLSLVAQTLMAHKVLECWLIWITVDVLSVGIYAYKALHLTAGLYAVFLCLATAGFFAWRRTMVAPGAAAPAPERRP